MIDKAEFKTAWRRLLVRFGKAEVNADQAMMYYHYLSELMTTEEFLRACQAVWATAKWFPRPADFLTVAAGSEWPRVISCMEAHHPPDFGWAEMWKELSPRTRAACLRLGGIASMKEQANRGMVKLREAFLAAYEEEATAQALALPAPPAAKQLHTGT